MNAHLRLERLIFEQLLLQAAIKSEFARLLGGRKVMKDPRAEASAGAALKQIVPAKSATIRFQAN